MILPQFIFKRKLKESGELLSSSKEKNLRAITDFGKGIETIICNQAEKENVSQTLITLGEMEMTQFKYYTLQNLVMFWTGPLKAIGLIGTVCDWSCNETKFNHYTYCHDVCFNISY